MADETTAEGASAPGTRRRTTLSDKQRAILGVIQASVAQRGYPPSMREIGEAVGLTSPSTVHSHLATLQRRGFLLRDPTKPRAIEVRWDPTSGAAVERRPVRHVPLVGEVAAGTDVLAQENIRHVECIEFPELGMEAVYRIDVEDFPAFLLVDDKGNDFFRQIQSEACAACLRKN